MSTSDPSDYEKDILATRQSHEAADIPFEADNGSRTADGKDIHATIDKEVDSASGRRELSLESNRNLGQDNAQTNVDVEKNRAKAIAPEEPEDPNVVYWDGPDDPANPHNWSNALKVVNVGLVSGICFVTPLASCK